MEETTANDTEMAAMKRQMFLSKEQTEAFSMCSFQVKFKSITVFYGV
jgi:hypothetical protein